MKSVEEVEGQCDQDRDQDQQEVFIHVSRFQIRFQGFKVCRSAHEFEVSPFSVFETSEL